MRAGFGDFGALAEFAKEAGAHGASAVAISPVHALFGGAPDHISPYAPSSRLYLNPLYATASADAARQTWRIDRLARRRRRPRSKRFSRISEDGRKSGVGRVYPVTAARVCWITRGLKCWMLATAGAGVVGWRQWPEQHRDSNSAAVKALTSDDKDVRFQLFLQWQAAKGLQEAQAAAVGAGMKVGLITDMAVGMDPSGSHAWSVSGEVLQGLSIGAPPDIYNPAGQNWGLTGFSPEGLRSGGYAGFIGTLRASMRHAGGIRLDHAMGLQRLWVVPDGAPRIGRRISSLSLCGVAGTARIGIAAQSGDCGGRRSGHCSHWLSRANFPRRTAGNARPLVRTRQTKAPFSRRSGGILRPPPCPPPMIFPRFAGWWTGHDIAWRENLGAIPRRCKSRAENTWARTQATLGHLRKAGCAAGGAPRAANPGGICRRGDFLPRKNALPDRVDSGRGFYRGDRAAQYSRHDR